MANKNEAIIKVSGAIEAAVAECGVHALAQLPIFLQAVQMAQGIRALREALTDDFVKSVIMPLQGTALGFLTDKDKEKDGSPGHGYPLAVVKDVVIEAMLRGFRIVGNEFNIIGNRFYGTKAGFSRHVATYPGLTDLVLQPGVPQFNADKTGAAVTFTASWKLRGAKDGIACVATKEGENVIDHRIPVRVNGGMGVDAVLGKAERKMLFRIYQRLNGSTYGAGEGDVNEIETVGVEVPQVAAPSPVPAGTPEGQRVKLPGKKNGVAPIAESPPIELDPGNTDLSGAQ